MTRPVELELTDVSLSFGGVSAFRDISFTVNAGEVFALMGPNGAGKTSLLNCINGYYPPQSGSIKFRGQELVGKTPSKIARLGMGRTFQNIELFRSVSVLDNLMLGREVHMKRGMLAGALWVGPGSRDEARHRAYVEELVEFLELGPYRHRPVGNLPYGKQKLVEIGRALATEPHLLLLDEPAAGMNREEKEDIARFIMRIRHERNVTQVLIEHDVRFVSDLSDRVAVLNLGSLIDEGPAAEVFANPAVREAYAGVI